MAIYIFALACQPPLVSPALSIRLCKWQVNVFVCIPRLCWHRRSAWSAHGPSLKPTGRTAAAAVAAAAAAAAALNIQPGGCPGRRHWPGKSKWPVQRLHVLQWKGSPFKRQPVVPSWAHWGSGPGRVNRLLLTIRLLPSIFFCPLQRKTDFPPPPVPFIFVWRFSLLFSSIFQSDRNIVVCVRCVYGRWKRRGKKWALPSAVVSASRWHWFSEKKKNDKANNKTGIVSTRYTYI